MAAEMTLLHQAAQKAVEALKAPTVTPRQLIEKWTPGICGDGSELALVLAIESTVLLIQNGAIPESRETRTFMAWHEKWSEQYLGGGEDDQIN